MRRTAVIGVLVALALGGVSKAARAAVGNGASVAALQVALRAHGAYVGPIDGVAGPLTRDGVVALQRRRGLAPDGVVGPATRRALGRLGRPLLGQRELWVGRRGWDVASLEFRLHGLGLLRASAIDGRFTPATATALRAFQRRSGLEPDGIAGRATFRALVRTTETGAATTATRAATSRALVHVVRSGEGLIMIARRYGVSPTLLAADNGLTLESVIVPGQRLSVRRGTGAASAVHVVQPGESWFLVAQRYRVSPHALAQVNASRLDAVIVPGQRLQLPAGADLTAAPESVASREEVRASLDRWAAVFGVDAKLVRAVAWMESGWQESVVSDIGALGVMQLMPETWAWVDSFLLGEATPRTADGNVRAGVRFLRWQLDHFGGDVDLALAGWYQGARAVREIGLYDDTKQFVSVVKALYGRV